MSGPGRRGLALAAALGAGLAASAALAGCETITEDEARCAEAVARLEACCPGDATRGAVCDGTFSVTVDEARCIEAIDCAALEAGLTNAVCATAASRFAAGTRSDGGLCP